MLVYNEFPSYSLLNKEKVMKTIEQELKQFHQEHLGFMTNKNADIYDSLWFLADTYPNGKGPWYAVYTTFHGGGFISKHRTAYRAILSARKHAISDCTCGCTVVVPEYEYENLKSAVDIQSPYAPSK
jgi:hypothetical protein